MRTMSEVDLGQEGIEYIRSCLSQGSGLCSRLLELDFAAGETFAPAPDDIGSTRVKQFNVGGLISRKETVDWLTRHLKQLFQKDAVGTFVLQDVWAKPEDVAGNAAGTQAVVHDENVYYVLGPSDVAAERISAAIQQLRSYLMVAVFARLQLPLHQLMPGGQVSNGFIRDLAKGTREVFVGAYDQEGLVVWRKSNR
jgi:hypothetical protein